MTDAGVWPDRSSYTNQVSKLGFEGPFSGSKHQFMIKDSLRLRIPNPHKKEVGKNLLMMILKQAGISKKEWEEL